jgi:type IV pilus assembly protein PilM
MPKSVVGLDIGRTSVRAVEVEDAERRKPLVVRTHEVTLPEGAVVNGDVREVETVSSALRKLWSDGGFSSKNVVLGIGNQRVIARDLAVPKLPTLQQIREALPFQVQEMLPVPVSEALLDFYPISETDGENGTMVNGILVAAIKDAVMTNIKAVRQAGLTPVNVDLIPFALVRALVHGSIASTTVMLIDIGVSTTTVVVTDNGVPQFVRMIPAGGDDLTRALVSGLAISPEQAESLKASRGLSLAPATSELEHNGGEVIRATVFELLASIRNTLQYYVALRPSHPLQAIALTGDSAHLPGLAEAMGEVLRLPVVAASPSSTVELGKNVQRMSPDEFEPMTIALGLALGSAA